MRKRLHQTGKASGEYLIDGPTFIALMGALATLWRFIATGALSSLIQASASHALGCVEGIFDALLF